MKKPLPSLYGVYNLSGDIEPIEWLSRSLEAERVAVDKLLKIQHMDLLSTLSERFRTHFPQPDNGPQVYYSSEDQPTIIERSPSKTSKDSSKDSTKESPAVRKPSKESSGKKDRMRNSLSKMSLNSLYSAMSTSEYQNYPKHRASPSKSSLSVVAQGTPLEPHHNSLRRQFSRSPSSFFFDDTNGIHKTEISAVDETLEEEPADLREIANGGCTSHTASTASKSTRPSLRTKSIDQRNEGGVYSKIQKLVNHNYFEASFSVLIVLNTIVIAVEAQYDGIDIGYVAGFPGYRTAARDVWPGAPLTFKILEMCFGICFTIEVLLKAIALRCQFTKSFWNWFDTCIIVFWLATVDATFLNTMFLRLARLVRLLRMLRLTRTFQVFDVLHLLVGSLRASLSVLLWSLVLLTMIMVLNALLLQFLVEEHIAISVGTVRDDVFERFGTFTRSFLTMYEITLGNWIPAFRVLHENVSEWFGLYFLVYRSLVGFAVLNVISAVFLHETFKVASSDEEIMILQKERAVRTHMRNMKRFFEEADENDDGTVSYDEFVGMVKDPRVIMWLSAMELELEDVELVFGLMGCADGEKLSFSELAHGFANLKGAAKSVDMITMMHQARRIETAVIEVMDVLRQLVEVETPLLHTKVETV